MHTQIVLFYIWEIWGERQIKEENFDICKLSDASQSSAGDEFEQEELMNIEDFDNTDQDEDKSTWTICMLKHIIQFFGMLIRCWFEGRKQSGRKQRASEKKIWRRIWRDEWTVQSAKKCDGWAIEGFLLVCFCNIFLFPIAI